MTHSCLNVMIDTSYYPLCCVTALIRADQFFPSYESSVVLGDDLEAARSAFWSHAAPCVMKLACTVSLKDV